jgi:hypothetical protein
MRILQVTMTGAAVQIAPLLGGLNQAIGIYCSVLQIQNNGSNNMRVGDNTVTAIRGQIIFPTGGEYTAPCPPKGTRLSDWWLIGTSGDIADILYETAQ